MIKSSKRVDVYIELPENFKEIIEESMVKELSIASVKWGVSITEEEGEEILDHAIEQLKNKVLSATQIEWNFTQILHVRLRNERSKVGGRVMNFPTSNQEDNDLTFYLKGDGLRMENEPSKNLVKGKDLHTFFMDKIEDWGKTAVFYGVASYNGV